MPSPRSVPTTFNGTRYRSRLEVRWAALFTALAVPFDYELQAYQLKGRYYLPDFWLRALKVHAEVKPVLPDRATLAAYAELAHSTGYPLILLVGQPATTPCLAILPSGQGQRIALAASLEQATLVSAPAPLSLTFRRALSYALTLSL